MSRLLDAEVLSDSVMKSGLFPGFFVCLFVCISVLIIRFCVIVCVIEWYSSSVATYTKLGVARIIVFEGRWGMHD